MKYTITVLERWSYEREVEVEAANEAEAKTKAITLADETNTDFADIEYDGAEVLEIVQDDKRGHTLPSS